jgi:hypothetical protein
MSATVAHSTKPTWGSMVSLSLASAYVIFLAVSLAHPNWTPPAERDLTRVGGRFVNNPIQPYEFVTDAGQRLVLGCEPEELGKVHCLELVGASRSSLAGQHAEIGYFQVHTPVWESKRRGWPNILVTAELNGHPILRFADRSAVLQREFRADQGISDVVAAFLLIFALLVLFLVARAAVFKIKQLEPIKP